MAILRATYFLLADKDSGTGLSTCCWMVSGQFQVFMMRFKTFFCNILKLESGQSFIFLQHHIHKECIGDSDHKNVSPCSIMFIWEVLLSPQLCPIWFFRLDKRTPFRNTLLLSLSLSVTWGGAINKLSSLQDATTKKSLPIPRGVRSKTLNMERKALCWIFLIGFFHAASGQSKYSLKFVMW